MTGQEHVEPGTAGPLSAEQVKEAARDVIRQLAPEELPVFDSVAEAWLADAGRQRRGKSPGASVGFGVEEVLLTELTFPIIAAAVGEVLGNVAEDGVWERIKRWVRQRATATVQADGTGAAKSSESAARDVLTGQQARAVRDACERQARTLGMPAAKAKVLADAVLGSLTYGRGGD